MTLTAYSDAPGYVFSHWSGGASNLLTSVTDVTLGGSLSVQAVFAAAQEISTVEELQAIANMSGNYRLAQDIDAAATTNWNSGAGFVALGQYLNPFRGVFDGNGHTLFNLTVNQPQGHEVGLFARVGPGGVVRNIRLAEATVRGHTAVGCIAGLNQGRVARCEVSGVVTGCLHVGAIVGASTFGVVSGCGAAARVAGDSRVGGIAGLVDHGWVSRCYAAGALSSGGSLGGSRS